VSVAVDESVVVVESLSVLESSTDVPVSDAVVPPESG
jgi:hypothetical protein